MEQKEVKEQKQKAKEFKKLLIHATDLYENEDFKKFVKEGGVPMKVATAYKAIKEVILPHIKNI